MTYFHIGLTTKELYNKWTKKLYEILKNNLLYNIISHFEVFTKNYNIFNYLSMTEYGIILKLSIGTA